MKKLAKNAQRASGAVGRPLGPAVVSAKTQSESKKEKNLTSRKAIVVKKVEINTFSPSHLQRQTLSTAQREKEDIYYAVRECMPRE